MSSTKSTRVPFWKREVGTLPSLMIICLVIIAIIYGVTSSNTLSEQRKMEAYLKEKYGKEFVVSNIRTEGSGFGVRGEVVGDALPKKELSPKFEVSNMSDGYHDQYVAATWLLSEQKKFPSIIAGANDEVSISGEIYVLNTVDRSIRGNFPSLDEMSEEYKHGVTYYLHVREKEEYSPQQDDVYMKRLKAVSKYLIDKKAVGNKYVGYIIPDKAGYQYSLGLESARLEELIQDNNASFAQYFKHVRSE